MGAVASYGMRRRTVLSVFALVVLAVPAAVVGVDAIVRWTPVPDTGIAARIAAVPDLDAYLARREAAVAGVKRDLRKTIIWHDASQKAPTRIAIVYLHGFTASRREMSPVVERLADSLGANVFFTRLAAHGMTDGEAFGTVRPQAWMDDAREALAIGRRIGARVLVVGMSTGAVLAEQLAMESADSAAPAALILVSPNHAPANNLAWLAAGPLGRVVAKLVVGSHKQLVPDNAAHAYMTTQRYRSEGIVAMMDLVRFGQTIDVSRITRPLLTLYTRHDDVVRVDLIRERHARFGSPIKEIVDVPETTRHVLAGDVLSPQAVDPVVTLMLRFAQRALGVPPT